MRIVQKIDNINGSWNIDEALSLQGRPGKSVVVGVGPVVVVGKNTKRKGLIILNGSSQTITLGFGNIPTIYEGGTLYPGGTFNMNEFDFFTGDVYAVATGPNGLLMIQEFE